MDPFENNPYAVSGHGELSSPVISNNGLYVVGKRKFLLLSILTLNFYLVVWSYKNWNALERRQNTNISPFLRAMFYIFFTHRLMRTAADEFDQTDEYEARSMGTKSNRAIAVIVVSNFLDRVFNKFSESPAVGFLTVGTIVLAAFFMSDLRSFINHVSGDPDGKSNDSLSGANIAWMVAGSIFWLLVLIGLFAST